MSYESVLHSKSLAETGGNGSRVQAALKRVSNFYLAIATNTSNVMLLKDFPLSGWMTEKV